MSLAAPDISDEDLTPARPALWTVFKGSWSSFAAIGVTCAMIATVAWERSPWRLTVLLMVAVPFNLLALLYGMRSWYHTGAARAYRHSTALARRTLLK